MMVRKGVNTMFQYLRKKLVSFCYGAGIKDSLALHRRGEVRQDGLALVTTSHRLEIEWRAREIHPWDRGCSSEDQQRLFADQCFLDTEAAISRLFAALPMVDVVQFRVLRPDSDDQLLGGTITRPALRKAKPTCSTRSRLWQMGVQVCGLSSCLLLATLHLISRNVWCGW
jgi:hypothetical protein